MQATAKMLSSATMLSLGTQASFSEAQASLSPKIRDKHDQGGKLGSCLLAVLGLFSYFSAIFFLFSGGGQNQCFPIFFPISGRRPENAVLAGGQVPTLVNQLLDSDFYLAGVPLRMTLANYDPRFQNHEWTRIKLRIHSAKLRKGARLQPQPHFKITNPKFRISRLQTEILKLRSEVLNLEISDYERTKNPATKPKFAWAKNNHEITKLAGVQYAACSVTRANLLIPPTSCRHF